VRHASNVKEHFFERELHFMQGRSGIFENSVTRVDIPGQPPQMLCILRDVTQQRRSALELARAKEAAEAANRELIAANRNLEETGRLAREMADRAEALSAAKSVAYIDYRLQAQNGSAKVFESNALKYLVDAAGGIPRRLNVLCHNALLLAYSKKKNTVTLEVAREVVGDYEGIFPPSIKIKPPVLLTVESATREPATIAETPIGVEPAIRPRRPMALAAAACAALAVLGFGSVFVARTSNLPGEFDRMAHQIEAAPVSPEASSHPADDVKTAAATLGYTASIADASVPPTASPKTESAPAPRQATVQIRAGDTFHDLAVKYLGSKDRTRELIAANPQIKDPDNLYVGQTIYLPAREQANLAGEVQ